MANLIETPEWVEGIYQFEGTDVIEGGVNGIDNVPTRQLANRTAFLKNALETLGQNSQPRDDDLTAIAALVSAADRFPYATDAGVWAMAVITAFARSLLEAADAAAARTALGLGGAATKAVGTGASDVAAGNHSHGATYQAQDAELTALAGLNSAANKLPYFTGLGTAALADLTAFARTLLDDLDAAAARTTLGLGGAATLNVGAGPGTVAAGDHGHALLAPLASPAFTNTPTTPTAAPGTNNTQIANTAFVATAIANLIASSPGALDTLNELAAALGNDPNFATTITNALAGKQPIDSDLTAIAALVSAADKLPYATGPNAWALTAITAFGRSLIAAVDAAAARTALALGNSATQNVGTGAGTVAAGNHNHGTEYVSTDANFAVGTVCFCRQASGTALAEGSITAGANLYPGNGAGGWSGTALTGTWRTMGFTGASGHVTCFQRIL